jgi:hypothetical protein
LGRDVWIEKSYAFLLWWSLLHPITFLAGFLGAGKTVCNSITISVFSTDFMEPFTEEPQRK